MPAVAMYHPSHMSVIDSDTGEIKKVYRGEVVQFLINQEKGALIDILTTAVPGINWYDAMATHNLAQQVVNKMVLAKQQMEASKKPIVAPPEVPTGTDQEHVLDAERSL